MIFLIKIMISLLIFLIFFPLSLQDSQIFPSEQVVMVGDTFRIDCRSSLKPNAIDWKHKKISSTSLLEIYSYYTKSFDPIFKNDFYVNYTEEVYSLVCTNVKLEFAGTYYCVLDDEQTTDSQIIIIESNPSCLSNISSSGNIGKNSCFLKPDYILRSCSVKYYANIAPKLKWKDVPAIDIFNTNITEFEGVHTISQIVMLSRFEDGKFFECFVENVFVHNTYSCDTAKLNVLYALNSSIYNYIFASSNQDIQCKIDTIKENLSCQFSWQLKNNEGIYEHLLNGLKLSPIYYEGQSRNFKCIGDCRIKNQQCVVEAMLLEVNLPLERNIKISAIIGICIGIVFLFALVFFLIIFLRRRCFLSQLNDRPHTDQDIPLMNTDPNVFKNNNGLHDKLDSSDIVSSDNHMDGNQIIDNSDSGNHDQVNQISGNQVNNAASIIHEGLNVSRAESNLKKSMDHINNLQSPIAEEETYEEICSIEINERSVISWTSNKNRIFGVIKTDPGFKLIIYDSTRPFIRLIPEEINIRDAKDCRDIIAINNHIYISDYSDNKCLWQCDVAKNAEIKVIKCPMIGKPGFMTYKDKNIYVLIRVENRMTLTILEEDINLKFIKNITFSVQPAYLPVLVRPSSTSENIIVFRTKLKEPFEWHLSEISIDGVRLIKDYNMNLNCTYFCYDNIGNIIFSEDKTNQIIYVTNLETGKCLLKTRWAPIRLHWRDYDDENVLFVGGKKNFAMYRINA